MEAGAAEPASRSVSRSPWAYAACGLGLVGVGAAVVLGLGTAPVPEVVAGVLAAWGLQVAAFPALWRSLERGRPATGAWVTGMGVRLGGLAVAFAVVMAGAAEVALGVAYGLSLLALLLLEATWLALWAPSTASEPHAGRAAGSEGRGGGGEA